MRTAAQIGLDLNAKRAALAAIFTEHKNDAGEYDLTVDQLAEIENRNTEITALQGEYEKAAEVEAIAAKAMAGARAVPADQPAEAKAGVRSVGDILAKSADYAAFQRGDIKGFRMSLSEAEWKTAITLAGIAPLADRQDGITGYPAAMATIDDLLLDGTTTSNVISYWEATAETDNTATRTEGSAVTDNAETFTERTDTVRAITSWQPATVEALKDNAQLESFIRYRLPYLVAKARTTQLLTGDGNAPNLRGLLNRTNIQTQARGADPHFDAIMKAMTLVALNGDAVATGVILHPTDAQTIRLARTADGIYILGNPANGGSFDLWGLPVRVTPQITQGTALVGAFKPMTQIFRNGGLVIEVSTEHSTYFTERKVAILAEERLALACYRGQALAKVTGL